MVRALRKDILLDYIYNILILNLSHKNSSSAFQQKLPRHAEYPNVANQLV